MSVIAYSSAIAMRWHANPCQVPRLKVGGREPGHQYQHGSDADPRCVPGYHDVSPQRTGPAMAETAVPPSHRGDQAANDKRRTPLCTIQDTLVPTAAQARSREPQGEAAPAVPRTCV